jgi:uncharacterized membrane protein YphA (DoxX/SURF4 family)
MSIILWVLQVVLAAPFLALGLVKAFQYEQASARSKWIKDLSRGLLAFIGICEILGAVGLILPALTGILPWLTPLAALGLATIMILAAGFHARRREYRSIITNLILLTLAACIVYGRWVLAPL